MKISELIEALQQIRDDFQWDNLEVIFAKCNDKEELQLMKEEGIDWTNAEYVEYVTVAMWGEEPYCVLQMLEDGWKDLWWNFGKIVPYIDE